MESEAQAAGAEFEQSSAGAPSGEDVIDAEFKEAK